MSTLLTTPPRTMAHLLKQLGDVPPERVRLTPTPGTATIDDLLRSENERCELVDGTLVEKAMGYEESFLAAWFLTALNNYVGPRRLGTVTGEAGFFELPDGPVRGPDVAFISRKRMPGRKRFARVFPRNAPELVIEVLSKKNTRAEMTRKRGEYFRSGVIEVWEVDPRKRSVRVYTAENAYHDFGPSDVIKPLVLPGFVLNLADVFGQLDALDEE